jgi:hypothetical protein
MKRWIWVPVLIIALLPVIALSAQTDPQTAYDNPNSPVDLIASYYDAITDRDYQRAYNYWETAPETLQTFAQGFSDTLDIQVIVQPPTRIGAAAGSLYVQIPTVLIADHTDGTQHYYSGCFTTRKSNVPASAGGEDFWRLYSADVVEVSRTASIAQLLRTSCDSQ